MRGQSEVNPEVFLKGLLKRKQELMEETFERPPTTFEQFQNQLGRYQEVVGAIQKLEILMRGDEDDDL